MFRWLAPLLTASVLSAAGPILFEGARVIADARRAPIENAAFLIDNGRIIKTGKRGEIAAPKGAQRIDLTGKTVIPAIIDAHVHLGYQKGLIYAAENYTRENVLDQLDHYAYAGVGAVLSLGTDLGDIPFAIRADQQSGKAAGALLRTAGRGFAAPDAGPNDPALKPSAIGVTTEEEARRGVREQIARKVDIIKVWVDDRNGTVQKLSPQLYRAIIDEAHKHRVKAVAHVFYLDDAKELVRAGIDGFAHLVRDREMDDELVRAIVSRGVTVIPNIAISENAVHGEAPPWVSDNLLAELAPAAVIARVRASYLQRQPAALERARVTYAGMQHSMQKLNAAGARIAFGADAGATRDHFHAYTDHREMGLMVAAGMTPAQVLTAATVTSAAWIGLADYGTLEPGKSASFVVLDSNPLDDIANTKKISRVFLRGQEIDRPTLRSRWSRE